MRFQPKTENEIAAMGLIEAGSYPFEVVEAKEAKSKSGNDMIALKLKIWDKDGHERVIFDYLLEAMAHKLRHFAECTGLLEKYELGFLNADDCCHRSGNLELIIQKDKTGQFADKNSVKDYLKKSDKSSVEKKSEEFFNDELPF